MSDQAQVEGAKEVENTNVGVEQTPEETTTSQITSQTSSGSITAEDIDLIKNNSESFPECSAAIEAYKAETDDAKKKEHIEKFINNYVNEKTVYILKTNADLEPVRKALGDGAVYTDLNSFIEQVKENPEALNALNSFISGEKTSEQEEEFSDEDPWIASALGKLRSKKLF